MAAAIPVVQPAAASEVSRSLNRKGEVARRPPVGGGKRQAQLLTLQDQATLLYFGGPQGPRWTAAPRSINATASLSFKLSASSAWPPLYDTPNHEVVVAGHARGLRWSPTIGGLPS